MTIIRTFVIQPCATESALRIGWRQITQMINRVSDVLEWDRLGHITKSRWYENHNNEWQYII